MRIKKPIVSVFKLRRSKQHIAQHFDGKRCNQLILDEQQLLVYR